MKHSHGDNFTFIHINKTGGSSVAQALNLPLEHKTALEKIEIIGENNWARNISFTVVRNPWDKVVSHYHYRAKTNQTGMRNNPIKFTQWVKRAYGNRDPFYHDKPKMFMPQTDWIVDKDGNVIVDEIIHFENIEEEFNDVLVKIGKQAFLPHIKKSNRGGYRQYYDEGTTEIVRNWFERDIERFDYQF